MRYAWDKRHAPKNFGDIRIRFESNKQPSGNPSNFTATTVRQCGSKVLAEALFEEVAIAFLQAKFVVMNNEKSIHGSIIMGCLRLGEQ